MTRQAKIYEDQYNNRYQIYIRIQNYDGWATDYEYTALSLDEAVEIAKSMVEEDNIEVIIYD